MVGTPHDHVDINPSPNLETVRAAVDLATGNWSGDFVPLNQGFSEGDGKPDDVDGRGKVFFDISTLNTTAIRDKYIELGGAARFLGDP